ncbi:MAG: Aromatic/aminoadipate aminotransferase 1, partial [Pleopsidium flavum]
HWIRINWLAHPSLFPSTTTTTITKKSFLEIEESIFQASVERGVLVMKGSWFRAERDVDTDMGMFFRATFAAAPGDQVAEGIRRFGEALRGEFSLH